MQLLKLENVSKRFGEKLILDSINLTISKGDKIALVAKNGSGKTTLLEMIAGTESPEGEHANVEVAHQIKKAYLSQNPVFNPESTIEEAIFDSDNKKLQLVRDYKKAQLFNDDQQIQDLAVKIDTEGAWALEAQVNEILGRFNIHKISAKMGSLSGGQVKRVALAKIVLEEPEFLILDEPTNHLDLDMIEWLEVYLSKENLSLFMVTHDRYFLENICNDIIELDSGQIYKYKGSYSEYLEKKHERIGNESVQQDKMKKLFKKELEWIRKMPKARTTKAKSRQDVFHDIKKEISEYTIEKKLEINLEPARLGSKILEAHAITKSFDELKIIDTFSYKFKKGEKVGIVGNNGVGKSTFVNMLTKTMRPDGGKVVIGDTVKFGYYRQEGMNLDQDKRVIDAIRDIAEYLPLKKGLKLTAESLLERFLFPRSQQQVYISKLSGGEQRRLYLLQILMENPNFLILDEPTNDLDIMTLNVLENYLMQFPGCAIIITHDRYFLDKIVDHIFIMEGNGVIRDYNGMYSEYRMFDKVNSAESNQTKETKVEKTLSEADRKLQNQKKNQIRKVEREIEKLEEKKSKIETQLSTITELEEIQKLSIEIGEIQTEIEEKEMIWMELNED